MQFVKGSVIRGKYDVSYPHTVHCIPSGDVMIHTLGNAEGDAKGNFYLLDGKTFEPKGLWNSGKENIMGHDFWYQPRFNIMISTELGAPKKFSQGFAATDLALGIKSNNNHREEYFRTTLLFYCFQENGKIIRIRNPVFVRII